MEFLTMHDHALSDVLFQTDADCVNFLKDNGVGSTDASRAHMLSDIVAWANNRNRESLRGVISIDLTVTIRENLREDLG